MQFLPAVTRNQLSRDSYSCLFHSLSTMPVHLGVFCFGLVFFFHCSTHKIPDSVWLLWVGFEEQIGRHRILVFCSQPKHFAKLISPSPQLMATPYRSYGCERTGKRSNWCLLTHGVGQACQTEPSPLLLTLSTVKYDVVPSKMDRKGRSESECLWFCFSSVVPVQGHIKIRQVVLMLIQILSFSVLKEIISPLLQVN